MRVMSVWIPRLGGAVAITLALGLGGTACKKKASCESVAEHVHAIYMADPKIPDEAKKQMTKEVFIKQSVESCKKQPGQAQLDCAMKAKTMEEATACIVVK